MKNTVPMMMDGEVYDLPAEEVENFTKASGGKAQRAFNYRVNGEDYTIPESEVEGFAAASGGKAEPVRRLSFANGTTRSFTGEELRKFMAKEYRESDDFNADREEVAARMSEKIGGEDASVPVDTVKGAAEGAYKGASYVAKKGALPWLRAFFTAPLRLMAQATSSGMPINPSLAAGNAYSFQTPKETGEILKAAASAIEAPFIPTEEDANEVGAFTRGVGKVNEVAQTIGSFAAMVRGPGPLAGVSIMSAEAGNDTYIGLYDNAIAQGADPERAHKYAMGGSAIATIGTAAMGVLPISRILKMGTPVVDATAGGTIKGYNDLVRQAMVGNVKKYLADAAVAGGESAAIMFGQAYGEKLMEIGASGKDPTTWDAQSEALFEAAKAGGEGLAVGAIFGGLHFADYKRSVRIGVEAQARQASTTPEGRRMWAQMFPEATANIIQKRAKGQDISRMDIMKAGYPEMSQKERNQVGDWLKLDAEDFIEQNMEAIKAAQAEAKAAKAEPKVSPAPYAKEGEEQPIKAEVVIPEKPVDKTLPSINDADRAADLRGQIADARDEWQQLARASAEGGADKSGKLFDAAYKNYMDLQKQLNELDGTPVVDDLAETAKKLGKAEEPKKELESNEAQGEVKGVAVPDFVNDTQAKNIRRKFEADGYEVLSIEKGEHPGDVVVSFKDGNEPEGFSHSEMTWGIDGLAYKERLVRDTATETHENGPVSVPSEEGTSTRPEVTASATGDAEADFAALANNQEEFDRIFNEALGENEEKTEVTSVKTEVKPPKTVNKGKGAVPVAEKPTDVVGHTPQGKVITRAQKEQKAIAESFGGAMSAEDAATLHDLFGASADASAAADKMEMALGAKDAFDEKVYNTVTPIFRRTLDNMKMKAGGKSAEDFIKTVAKQFGPGARQYLYRFAKDLANEQRGEHGSEGTTGNRNGLGGGRDENAGLGNAEAGEPSGGNVAGRPAAASGGEGSDNRVRAGAQDGEGRGGRDGVRADGQMAGHEAGDGGVRPASGPVGNGLAAADARGGGDADGSSVVRPSETSIVHAENGNIDTRKSAPVRLTKGDRIKINAQAAELAERPVGSLTDAELEVLRQFTGAGGLGYRGKSADEQRAALNQHFTDYTVVDAMWNALEKAKVPLKDVCEPSAGNGNFPGRRPDKNWTLCELDKTTAKILTHLFPGAKVMQGTFEDVRLPAQDAFISNVPFLETRNHTNRPDVKTLHDFFFVHAIDQLKPNGVLAFITTHGTMDKADPAVRRELVGKGDVIGAYRLPQDMFKANAGTSVTTDVIFIQRRPDGVEARPENKAVNDLFVESESLTAADGTSKMNLSKFYAEHPENVLGDLREAKDKMYGGKPKMETFASDATDLSQITINYKPYPVAREESGANGSTASGASSEEGAARKYPHDVQGLEKAGVRYELNEGNGTYAQNIRMYDGVPHVAVEEFTLDGYDEGTHKAKVFEPISGEIAKKITALQYIVDDAAAFQKGDPNAQKSGLAEIEDYKKRFGKAPHKDRELRKFFNDHNEKHYFIELTSTFNEDFTPAQVFSERVRHEGSGRKMADENSSLVDQALASEDASGRIEIGGARSKVSESDVADLLESGYSIAGTSKDGKPVLQNNVIFESGQIYRRIDEQKALKAEHPELAATIDRQIARLESILPTPKTFDDIGFVGVEGWRVNNGEGEHEGWIMPVMRDAGIRITREANEHGMFEYFVSAPGILTDEECVLVGRRMSGKKLVDRDDDESDSSYMTRARQAESSMTDIYAKIRAKIAEEPSRVKRIEDAYNRENNGYVAPDYNKAGYLIKDTAEAFVKAGFPLRANQRQWVTQALIEGVGINAHDVGGGKTMAALALAHALKSRGVCHKPMFVVPSKTINTSWLNSSNGAQKLFPGAKIVNLGNLSADTRTKKLFELANSNADFVFISHEGFEAIQLPPEVESASLREFADSLIDATGDRNEAKKRDKLEAYISQVEKEERDTRLTFDKLGVDCIIADEAHNFKNVGVSSQLERQGLGKSFSAKVDKKTKVASITSHRAHDFRFKCDYVTRHNNGRNVFLLTATPTPNKPIELYTMLRHMGERVLADYGIWTDRDFAHRFFEVGQRMVNAATGGQKAKEILVELKNVYDLRAIMGRFIDRIPMSEFATKYSIPLPEEKVEMRFVEMSGDMENVQAEIQDRIRDAASNGFEAHEGADTVIGAFMNGRDAAVTPYVYGGPHARLRVSDRSHDPHTDKIELAVQLATHEVQRGIEDAKNGGKHRTVLIFSDVMGGEDRGSVPSDIKEALVARGFKPSEVAIITGSEITNPKTGNEIKATGVRAQELKGEIQDLFAPKGSKPAAPSIKVIIGSTQTIGEGLNLNTWTSLGINLDVPLTPGAFQQRKGRYIRFGNQHTEARTVNLMTRGSFDLLSYGIMSNKEGWNTSIWNAKAKDRINVEEEMASGSGIDPRRIEIECIRDPVEKIHRTVDYDLNDRQRAIDQARDALNAIDSRVATQKRAISEAKAREDNQKATIFKLRQEAEQTEATVPALEKKVETAKADLAECAAKSGQGGKVNELAGLLGKFEEAVDVREAAKKSLETAAGEYEEAYRAADNKNRFAFEAENPNTIPGKLATARDREIVKLDDAKKGVGAAKDAISNLIKTFSDDDAQAFARVYQRAFEAVLKAHQDAAAKLDSIPYHEKVIRTAKRDIEAAETRIREMDGKRTEAEQAFRDAVDAHHALGVEWYDDFGGQNQRFKVEKASAKAEMDARNSADDNSWEDWLDERQTIEGMAAPSPTGTRPLNKGKLPEAEPVSATGTAKPDHVTSASEIFDTARKLFPELHITNKGTYHKRGVLGWLEVENRVIRTVDPRAIGVLCHEIGHAVSRLALAANGRVKMPRDARTEFVSLGVDLYGSKKPNGGYAAEGFAEFTRGFLCDYDLAKDFPNAHKWFFEDFGDKNPEFIDRLFMLKEKVLGYINQRPEDAIRAKWDHSTPVGESEMPWIVRKLAHIKDGILEAGNLKEFRTNWVDSNWPVWRAMRTLGVDYNFHDPAKTPAERADLILNHPYMLATFFQGSALRFAEVDALHNTVDLYGEVTGDSLQKIIAPIVSHGKENLKGFWDFAVAMRGAEYAKRGLDFGNSRDELAATIRRYRSPENVAALKGITEWSHRILRLLVDAGGMTEKQYADICDANPFYIPIKRVFAQNEVNRARMKSGRRAIFNLKGGSQDIEAPAVALVEMAARVRQAAQQAKLVTSLVDMYDRAKKQGAEINKFMIEMPNPIKRDSMWANKVKEQIARIAKLRFNADDATIKAALQDDWTEELFSFRTEKYHGKGNIATVNWRDPATGEMKLRTFEVRDPAIIDMLTGYVKPDVATKSERVMQWLANGIRMGATVLKGSFSLVANPIRDTATGFHMNEYGHFVPVWSSLEGTINGVLNTDLAKTYFNLGGDMGSYYNGGHHAAAKEIAAQAEAPNAAVRILKKGIFNLIGGIFSVPEIGPRLIAHRNAANYWRKAGVGEKAANFIGRLCGGDVTIDFGRAGKLGRKVNRTVLFLNAAIRELDQLARASGLSNQAPWQNPGVSPDAAISDPAAREADFNRKARREHAKRFFERGACLTALAFAAYLMNNENEKRLRRWRELKPEYKWNNTVFDMGDGDGESPSIRLPVPFLDGLLFQSLPVAVVEAIRTKDAAPVNEVAKEMAAQLPVQFKNLHQALRNFSPAAPEIDLLANAGWNDRAIVPKRMQNLDPRDQFADNTTEFAKMVGEMFHISPIKFEYLYDQHTGGLVSGLIRDIESMTGKSGALGVNGDYSRLPIVGRIFLAPFSSSRIPGDFYDEMDNLTRLYNSGRATPEQLGKLRTMEAVYENTLADYSKARRSVLANADLSAEEGKRLADQFSKATIEKIRAFNEAAKVDTFREEGVRSAVSSLTNPGTTEEGIKRNRAILSDVDFDEARVQLSRYGKAHGWSAKTLEKRQRFLRYRW